MKHDSRRDSTRELRIGLAVMSALSLIANSPSHADLFAEEITSETPARRIIQGSDAIAGLGDWVLGNGVVCASVLGTKSEGQLIETGGTLVDLGHCGRDDDQFLGLEPLFNLSRSEILPVREIRAEVDEREARIVTEAFDKGIRHTTQFVLDELDPERIVVRSKLTREQGDPRRFFAFAELLHNTKSALRNFVINRSGPSEGFEHVSLEKSSYLEIVRALRRSEGIVIVGSELQAPPVSYLYRVVRAESTRKGAPPARLGHYSLGMESVTLTAVLSEPLWFDSDEVGLLQAAQGTLMNLPRGESLLIEREIRLSPHADVASLSDSIFNAPGRAPTTRVHGRVTDPGARLHIDRASGTDAGPLTFARPNRDGRFDFMLPPGDYTLRTLAPGNRSDSLSFRVEETIAEGTSGHPEIDLGEIDLGDIARVQLPRGVPMRLVFQGIGETADPVFGSDLTGLTIDGVVVPTSVETRDVHLAGIDSDPRHVDIAPGRYRVLATRGLEYSLTQAEIDARAGQTAELVIAPPLRELETPGWISADFHVHAAGSFDSTLPESTRLRTFAAEGCEVLVATEHDVVRRFDELIVELGLQEDLVSLSGLEVTTVSRGRVAPYTTGHVNVYPLPYQPARTRNGAIAGEGKRLREIIHQARSIPGERMVQLNHPRDPGADDPGGAFFEHLSTMGRAFDPALPIETEPNSALLEVDPRSGLRDIDFDAIEVLNGKWMEPYRLVFTDWLALLDQGYRPTGMANSDSHRLGWVVGVPRNYVRVANDRPSAFDTDAFMTAARGGEVFGTTGPLVDVSLGEASVGELFSGRRGKLVVRVRAASWVPVSTVRIHRRNGKTLVAALSRDTGNTFAPVEFDLEFSADDHLIVEVEGEPEGPYSVVLEGFRPLAFSNPIFVDADGDGQWQPRGL
ncbi:MAG: CehA/McbA family metallohydrolase [Myxococcota bacterium]|nr:CehA/McbA family metallohydrolase [Myxococcota bacterium]